MVGVLRIKMWCSPWIQNYFKFRNCEYIQCKKKIQGAFHDMNTLLSEEQTICDQGDLKLETNMKLRGMMLQGDLQSKNKVV